MRTVALILLSPLILVFVLVCTAAQLVDDHKQLIAAMPRIRRAATYHQPDQRTLRPPNKDHR